MTLLSPIIALLTAIPTSTAASLALDALALAVMLCALSPAVLFCINLRRYLPPPPAGSGLAPVSVLIPARNEERSIRAAIESVLASTSVSFELIVLDDASTDRTSEIVTELVPHSNGRLRLEHAAPLPPAWNGKQHACWTLANLARYDILCFIDADVRLAPDALARMVTFLGESQAQLVSGFPRQVTETWLESLLLPLIHFVLLGFLPISQMRKSADPSFAAGCGQFLMANRSAYFSSGGHAAIRETMHDGLRLPRLFRQHGLPTDLTDLTHLARCRMYTSAAEVWQGLAKNATEGIAAPTRILPISILLLLGQGMPFVLAGALLLRRTAAPLSAIVYVLVAVTGAWLPRLLATWRFRQPLRSALVHPLGIVILLAIQWYALIRKTLGGTVSWKQRSYAGE